MLVSGVLQSDSLIYIFFRTSFHYRLLQDIEYSSLCCAVNPEKTMMNKIDNFSNSQNFQSIEEYRKVNL